MTLFFFQWITVIYAETILHATSKATLKYEGQKHEQWENAQFTVTSKLPSFYTLILVETRKQKAISEGIALTDIHLFADSWDFSQPTLKLAIFFLEHVTKCSLQEVGY